MSARIVTLPGDGIGPEIMSAAELVLRELGDFDLDERLVGEAGGHPDGDVPVRAGYERGPLPPWAAGPVGGTAGRAHRADNAGTNAIRRLVTNPGDEQQIVIRTHCDQYDEGQAGNAPMQFLVEDELKHDDADTERRQI